MTRDPLGFSATRKWCSTDTMRFARIRKNVGGDYKVAVSIYASKTGLSEQTVKEHTQNKPVKKGVRQFTKQQTASFDLLIETNQYAKAHERELAFMVKHHAKYTAGEFEDFFYKSQDYKYMSLTSIRRYAAILGLKLLHGISGQRIKDRILRTEF